MHNLAKAPIRSRQPAQVFSGHERAGKAAQEAAAHTRPPGGPAGVANAGHEFGRIAVNTPGDAHEQEARQLVDEATSEPGSRRSRSVSRVDAGAAGDAPPVVSEALHKPGRALEDQTRAELEPWLGHDLSRVRIHTDATAAESTRAVAARAYTVGPDIVFGEGQYAPDTPEGSRLLAHELVHVGQQGQDGGGPKVLQRVGIFESISRFFGGGTFSDRELQAYVERLRATNRIEDHYDSDNKAREAVKRGLHKKEGVPIRVLLIRELITGHVADDDMEGVLTILEDKTTSPLDLERIVDGVGVNDLVEAFGEGDLADRLFLVLGESAKHRGDPLPSDWYVSYSALGAEQLRPPSFALVVDDLTARPAGSRENVPITPPKVVNTNPSGAPVPVKQGVSHPRDSVGRGFMAFHVAPVGKDGNVNTDPVQAPTVRSANYNPITRDRRQVYAQVDLKFAPESVGEDTTGSSSSKREDRGSGSFNKLTEGSETGHVKQRSKEHEEVNAREQSRNQIDEHEKEVTKQNVHTEKEVVKFHIAGNKSVKDQTNEHTDFSTDGRLLALLLLLGGPEGAALLLLLQKSGGLDILKETKFSTHSDSHNQTEVDLEVTKDVAKEYTTYESELNRERTLLKKEFGERAFNSVKDVTGEAAEDSVKKSTTDETGSNQFESSGTTDEQSRSRTRTAFDVNIEDATVTFDVR
jgi:hypothetical protein